MNRLLTSVKPPKGKILFFKGASQYNVLRVAADQTAKGFISKGYNVDMLDCSNQDDIENVASVICGNYDFIFGIQAVFFLLETDDGKSIFEYLNTPSIGWIFDDVFYHWQRAEMLCYNNVSLISIDSCARSHTVYRDKVYYMPHGAIESDNSIKFDKEYDILFPASISNYPDINMYCNDSVGKYLANSCIQKMIDNPTLSVRNALANVMNDLGEKLTTELQIQFAMVISYVSEYIRVYFRKLILTSLASEGFKVHVLGNNSDDEKFSENIIFYGSMDIENVISMMKKTKILINPIPNVYEGGLHERLLSGMLYDCIVYTPYTKYIDEQLGSRIEYIDLNDIGAFIGSVKNHINNYGYYNKFEENRRYAVSNTFTKRGEQLIELIEDKILNKR